MNKIYTSIEQSKTLLDILPLETADGFYEAQLNPLTKEWENLLFVGNHWASPEVVIPAWSLTALLNVLPSSTLDSSDDHHYRVYCRERFSEWHDNAVDACVEMILKLHKEGLL